MMNCCRLETWRDFAEGRGRVGKGNYAIKVRVKGQQKHKYICGLTYKI
jgi:hypothetical protein